jgi:hypothetical protein
MPLPVLVHERCMRVGLAWARSFGGKLRAVRWERGALEHRHFDAGTRRGALLLTASESERVLATLGRAAAGLAWLALADLAVRAALRLNLRWDTFAYHLPYAARRAGLPIPYEMNDLVRPGFDAYPILPELVQGALWRLTGSINATGVVNYLAFALFLAYTHRVLGAPLGLVALVSLTAPLVLIHASSSYVDLFGNAFLAIGLCSCLALYIAPERARRATVLAAPAALAAAAWSKYLLAPIAGVTFAIFAWLSLRPSQVAGLGRARLASYQAAMGLLAAAPYLKNLIVFRNPFWPLRLPLIGDWFPYTNDALRGAIRERPISMRSTSQLELFARSLFEVDQPTSYPDRLRWIIDQGSTVVGFRTGGFWGVAALVYAIALPCLLVVCHGKRGWVASAALLGALLLVAHLPQSHELRYYMFIPLTGAGCVGLLFPRFQRAAPHAAMGLLALVLGLFVHMVVENLPHYRVSRVGQIEAARAWGAAQWWPKLRRGETYCAVDMQPIGMLLTGPTLSEFEIVDRSRAELCPSGSHIIRNEASSP